MTKMPLHGPRYDMRALGFAAGEAVVVTGAGSGIGKATALAAAHSGLAVAAWDIDAASAKATAREAEALGVRATGIEVDVANPAQLAGAWEAALQLGPCRYLEIGRAHV